MSSRVRKVALTIHVTVSVGWLGAVAGFVALAVAGLVSEDAQRVRSVYLAMEVTAWFVIVPLAVASLLTGLVQGLGTTWGLFRHYWVVFKLLINVFATVVLLLYMETLGELADVAASLTGDDLRGLRSASPLLHSVIALLLLVAATTLAVHKPRGVTPFGRRAATGPAGRRPS